MSGKKYPMIHFRASSEMIAAIDAMAKKVRRSRSQWIKLTLENALGMPVYPEQDHAPTIAADAPPTRRRRKSDAA